jgi:tetratricopeptide (TPR) repeat protein
MIAVRRFSLVVIATLMITADAAHAQLSSNWKGCTGNPDVEWKQQIERCSDLISSGAESQQNLAIAYYNRGLAYENLNNYAKAIADYSEALALDPEDADALLYRGLDKIRLGDKAGGDADIAAAKRIDPNIGR